MKKFVVAAVILVTLAFTALTVTSKTTQVKKTTVKTDRPASVHDFTTFREDLANAD